MGRALIEAGRATCATSSGDEEPADAIRSIGRAQTTATPRAFHRDHHRSSRCSAYSIVRDNLKERPQPNLTAETRGFLSCGSRRAQARIGISRVSAPFPGGRHRRLLRLLQTVREAQTLILLYDEATRRSKSQLLREAVAAEDRRHVLKINRTL